MTTFPKTLVVEDDAQTALQLQGVFKEMGVTATVHFVSDGVEAIDYLRGKELFEQVASSTLPGLLLLDLDVPRIDGFEVLQWLRQRPHLRPAKVVVFSSVESAELRSRVKELGADYFLVKPAPPEDFRSTVLALRQYLLGAAGSLTPARAARPSLAVLS